MSNEKNNQSINQIFNQSLNKSLDLIDEQTQNELSSIRRRVLQAAQEETPVDANHIAQNNTAVLSVHPLWRNKKITSIGLGFALAASFMLAVLMPNMQKNTSQDFSTDFALYTEVDPDWLADMDIAYALGDE
jgi:hypothetical protein